MYRIMPFFCIQSSTEKLLEVRSGAERTLHGNDLELIPTIKVEAGHPTKIYFCREFPAVCSHCGVLADIENSTKSGK